MSGRGFYIADAKNYIQRQFVDYIESNMDSFFLRVSYRENDERKKTGKITKVLNKTKPNLFRSYLEKSEVQVIDLILNPEAEKDVDLICKTIQKAKSIDNEIKIIVLSSYESWKETDIKKIYIRRRKKKVVMVEEVKEEGDGEGSEEDNGESNRENITDRKDSGSKIDKTQETNELSNKEAVAEENKEDTVEEQVEPNKVEIEQEIADPEDEYEEFEDDEERDYQTIKPEYFQYRDGGEPNSKTRELEDKLDSLTGVSDNISVYFVYVGLLYGQQNHFLKNEFERAWKQQDTLISSSPIIKEATIPVFNVSFLPKMVFQIIENEEFISDFTQSCVELTTELTRIKDKDKESMVELDEAEESGSVKNEEESPKGKKTVVFLNEAQKYTHESILTMITEGLGNFVLKENNTNSAKHLQTNYAIQENEKVKEYLLENNIDFKENFKYVIRDFLKSRDLRAIKVFSHCSQMTENVIKMIGANYNIKVIDLLGIDDELDSSFAFKRIKAFFDEDELDMLKGYKKLVISKKLTDVQKEFLTFLLKYRLNMNDVSFNGYLLFNAFALENFADLDRLFYLNNCSVVPYTKRLEKAFKKRETARIKEDKRIAKEMEKQRKLEEEMKKKEEENEGEADNNEEETKSVSEDNKLETEKSDNEDKNEDEEEQEEEEVEEEEPEEEVEEEQEPEEETEIKRKRERFFPDHFLLTQDEGERDEFIQKIIHFSIEKKNNYFHRFVQYDQMTSLKYQKELFYEMFIYLSRNKQPFNFIDQYNDIVKNYLVDFVTENSSYTNLSSITKGLEERFNDQYFKSVFKKNLNKFKSVIKEEEKEKIEQKNKLTNTRKFITECFYEVLNGSLLEIKKLKVSDPFEFLSNYVFEYSNNNGGISE